MLTQLLVIISDFVSKNGRRKCFNEHFNIK